MQDCISSGNPAGNDRVLVILHFLSAGPMPEGLAISAFEFRISDFLRISAFELDFRLPKIAAILAAILGRRTRPFKPSRFCCSTLFQKVAP
jgi:hypothetical protein